MEIININPMDIQFPYANNELGLRPEPKETDSDWDETLEVIDDIRENGLDNLFSVREIGEGKYAVGDGSRRLKACQVLYAEGNSDFQTISVQLKNMDEIDSLERQIAGNATIKSTNTKQYARGLMTIATAKGYNLRQLAKAAGKSETFVNNMLRFTRLPEEIQSLVSGGQMTITNAIALTKLPKDLDLSLLVEDACALDTGEFGLKVKETVDAYAAEKKARKGGSEPEFELTERKLTADCIKSNLEKAKNLCEDDPSEFNRGYKLAYEEIFQIDEKSAAERLAQWEAAQEAKKVAREARKADTEAKKRKELVDYAKKHNITSLDQLTTK